MQIILSQIPGRILEIKIEAIKQVKQDNMDCLTLFYESGGGIDNDYIEATEDGKTLFLSGILNFNFENHENIYWSFSITADKIDILEHLITDDKEDYLYDNSFISFNKLLPDEKENPSSHQ